MESQNERARRFRRETEQDLELALAAGVDPQHEYERTLEFLRFLDDIKRNMPTTSPEGSPAPTEGTPESGEPAPRSAVANVGRRTIELMLEDI